MNTNNILKDWKCDVAVLIIFFSRDKILAKTFAAVKEARPRKLLLWQDGAREGRQDDIEGIKKCREIVDNIDWNCEVYKNYQTKNWGCDPSTFYSHKWAFTLVDKCIILEDDCIASQSFFSFCKNLLDKYENDLRINRICGTNHDDITEYCPYDYFFSQAGSVCGWATWKRVADTWDEDYHFATSEYEMKMLERVVDIDYQATKKKLDRHILLKRPFWESINSYARLLNHQLVIVPKYNMIVNVGIGEESTHCGADIKELSRSAQSFFQLNLHEINSALNHPPYVTSDLYYYDRIASPNSFASKIESVMRRLLRGNFKSVFNAFKRFIGINKNEI